MGRIGKISPIKKDFNKNAKTFESSLASAGYVRSPGTSMTIPPYREPSDGSYVTGLDPNALYIQKMKKRSPEAADLEIKRVTALREELEGLTGLDLSPRSDFYTKIYDTNIDQSAKVSTISLKDDDIIFDLDNPYQAIQFAWASRHPLVASSYAAWERGEYPASVQFYVSDEEVENEIAYKRKTEVNRAIHKLESMGIEDRRKVARLLGLPITDNSKEVYVYNTLDNFIKASDVLQGKFKGNNPLTLFNRVTDLDAKMLNIKDLIEQSIRLSIYREDKDGTLRQGSVEIAKNSDDYAVDLAKSKNQDKLLALTESVETKKMAEI